MPARLDFFPDLAFGWIFYSVLMSILIVASVVDFRSLRIPKYLTIPCLILGVAFNLCRGMWLGFQGNQVWRLTASPDYGAAVGAIDGFLFSATGFASAFIIFLGLWILQAAKGGDVKLFAAVAAWVGPWYMVLLMIGSVVMVVIITMGMMLASLVTSGFSETRKSFSSQGSRKAIATGKRGKQRGPTFSFPLAFASAVILLFVWAPDLGLVERQAVVAASEPSS